MENSIYDGKFEGNILVLGRTECGKTTFIQNLAINEFFGDLKTVKWVSGIRLSKKREAEIESNFNCEVSFAYPNDKDELADKIEEYKLESESQTDENNEEDYQNVNIFGENKKRDKLIVFDDVSGLADESKKFASFLTVARKYNYNCVYAFHTIYTEKANWRTILSQTNIFNIFPASVPINSVKKILELGCIRKTNKYIPQGSLWISRLFIELANKNYKVCLTLDCSNVNKEGPGRFRTKADNPDTQFCYFNNTRDEQVYNQFISKRIKAENNSSSTHLFEIVEVVSKFDKNIKFDATNKLKELDNDTETSRASETHFDGTKKRKRIFERIGSVISDSANRESEPIDREKVSLIRNSEILRKRAKPGYLLKR